MPTDGRLDPTLGSFIPTGVSWGKIEESCDLIGASFGRIAERELRRRNSAPIDARSEPTVTKYVWIDESFAAIDATCEEMFAISAATGVTPAGASQHP